MIDGEDLRERTEELLEETIDAARRARRARRDYPEDWDLEQLVHECAQYFPTQFTVDDLSEATTKVQLSESLLDEALEQYRARDEQFPGGEAQAREIERDVMLQIIDQRWRDHLAEMDYLREGINLRAMGQQDPLVAWQKEGFDMFGADDGGHRRRLPALRHARPGHRGARCRSRPRQASYQAAEDPVMDSSALRPYPGRRASSTRRFPVRTARTAQAHDGPERRRQQAAAGGVG